MARSWSARASTTARGSTTRSPASSTSTRNWPHVAVVPLGLSRFNPEANLREHTVAEARAVIDAVEDWQDVYLTALGRRLVHAADEYYLMAGRAFPAAEPATRGSRCTRTASAWRGRSSTSSPAASMMSPAHGAASSPQSMLHATPPTTARRVRQSAQRARRWPCWPRRCAPIGILTGELGAQVLAAARRLARPRRRPRHPGGQRVLRREHRR